MFYRVIYACFQAWRYRKSLAQYATDPKLQITSIVDLSPEKLLQAGIKGLVIDFDGVLAADAKEQPAAEAITWLMNCCSIFGNNRIFILSNKPTLARRDYFASHFKNVSFIITELKKPFPYSILNILQVTKLLPDELLVIDDRLLTGILAAVISNVQGCLVTKPFMDYTSNPIREMSYNLVRNFEQWLFKILQ